MATADVDQKKRVLVAFGAWLGSTLLWMLLFGPIVVGSDGVRAWGVVLWVLLGALPLYVVIRVMYWVTGESFGPARLRGTVFLESSRGHTSLPVPVPPLRAFTEALPDECQAESRESADTIIELAWGGLASGEYVPESREYVSLTNTPGTGMPGYRVVCTVSITDAASGKTWRKQLSGAPLPDKVQVLGGVHPQRYVLGSPPEQDVKRYLASLEWTPAN